jgi:hypothetical protein
MREIVMYLRLCAVDGIELAVGNSWLMDKIGKVRFNYLVYDRTYT